MKNLLRVASIVPCVIAFTAFAADGAARIRAGTESWVKSFNSGNAGAVVALYAEDAVLMPPNALPARGSAAIKEAIAKDIAESKKAGVAFVLGTNDEVGISGDMAWHSGAYFVMDKANKPVDTGKYLEVWERKGGKWRVTRDIWNSNGAATASAPAPAAAAPKKK